MKGKKNSQLQIYLIADIMKYNWYPSNFQYFSFCERSFVSTV